MANLAMLLDLAADAMGDRIGVGSRDGGLTYAEIRRRAVAASADVAARSNGALAFADANGLAVPVALFAAAWAGVSYAPLNYRLPEAQQQVLLERLGSGYHVPTDGADAWLEGLGGADSEGYPDECAHPAVLLFTSGTTSEPKAAVLDHDNLLAYILNAGDFMAADEDEAVLMVVPPFHIAGVAGLLSSIYAGRRIVPLAKFTPEGWLDAVRAEQVTHAFVVPTMLARIVAVMEEQGGVELPCLRTLSYGGARMPVPVLERALELFPNAGFVNAYGLTETSSTVALLGPEDHRIALAGDHKRLASVGKALPGIEVEVVDDDNNPVAPEEEGRIRIRGPQVSGQYVGQDGAVDPEGWLVTGDIGTVDAEGYIFVRGRADDVIIAGGENISPSEIEDCLLRHANVTGAAVVGVPDDEWGEKVAAMVTVNGQVTPDELREWVRKDLGGLKAPKLVVLTDELPMTPTGKILRREVRSTLAP
ncbi:MAG: AMP-dependent synthetase [Actinomycetia bacterium]|nr:AMP-dependent synthetase [Actinomycetes bacterium]